MSKHPHAESMMEYAKDALETDKPWERWEYKHCLSSVWSGCLAGHPEWDARKKYRRKPKTNNINGYEVPEPVRRAGTGMDYWFPKTTQPHVGSIQGWTETSVKHRGLLQDGMLHNTREAAELHAKALLSFTKRD